MQAGPLSPKGRQHALGILLLAAILLGVAALLRAKQLAREAVGFSTYDRVRSVLVRRMNMPRSEVTLQSPLDRVDRRELVLALGEEFELNLAEGEADSLVTVEDAVRLIERARAANK